MTGRRHSRAPKAAGDVAELLRHLGDDGLPSARVSGGDSAAAAVLRSNALLAVERLRERHENGARLHAIVSRCDLGGELHKSVAADLGLSRRQFYRDLAFARGLVGRDVRAAAARPLERSKAPELSDDPRFRTAVVLTAGGHARAAIDHFSPAVDALEGFAAVWGHSMLASLLLDGGDTPSARRELNVAAERCNDDAGAELVALTQAKLDQQTGRAFDAQRALEGVVSRLESRPLEGSQLALDTRSEALALLAFCHRERGEFAAAGRCNAKNPARTGDTLVSPFARRYYLNVNAMQSCDGRAGPAAARRTCDAFYRFAVQNGFLDDVSAALLLLAGIARFERRLEDAERLASESLSIQRVVGGGDAPILGMLAGIAVDRGRYDTAVALAGEMREHAPEGSHSWWASQLHEAEALAGASRHARALHICRRAARESDDRDSRLGAWRRRIEATVFVAQGDNDGAHRTAGASLEILGDDAPPFHRLKTLLVAERARPSAAHRAKIRTLTALLGWSDAQH